MTLPLSGSVVDRLKRVGSPNADKQIRDWKKHWQQGARARWSRTSPGNTNPHSSGSTPAAAWSAGWNWAERNPDRRDPQPARLAHPHRRTTDTLPRLLRHAKAGAVGVSLLTVFVGLWEIRRRRTRVL